MHAMSNGREFRPEILPRRGELTAWGLSVGLTVLMLIVNSLWGAVPGFVWAFLTFLLFSASSISLGNWVDRRTVIRLEAGGIHFENGLRSVSLTWPEVQNVAVVASRAGKRVQVQGESSHFTFKLYSETRLLGQTMRSGFEGGQEILDTVLKSSNLVLQGETQGVYYYGRA
ncbi:MAG: hypothetical protein AB1564_17290 [Chloroflexota bacterium]